MSPGNKSCKSDLFGADLHDGLSLGGYFCKCLEKRFSKNAVEKA